MYKKDDMHTGRISFVLHTCTFTYVIGGCACVVRVLAAMLWQWSLFLIMITLVTLPSHIRNSHSGDRFSL